MPLPLIIDTDVAFDDWMAILFLLQSPHTEVRVITVAATGEAHARAGVQTILRLLALTNHPNIPVAAGRRMPLTGRHTFPLILRLIMDIRLGLKLPAASQRLAKEQAAQVLARHLRASTESLTIVALGPLTNLAELLLAEPMLAPKIAAIYIMGGAFDVPGNIREVNSQIDNAVAEWNIYIDPYALDVLLRSGVPLTLVPLDATNQVELTPAFIARVEQHKAIPAAEFLYRALRRLARLLGSRPYYFWDPLTAVLAVAPELANFREEYIRVIQEEGPQSGRTVIDPDGYPVRICTTVDIPAFEDAFLQGVSGRA